MKRSKGKAPVRPKGSNLSRLGPQSVLSSVPKGYLAMMKDIQTEVKSIDDSRPVKKRKRQRDQVGDRVDLDSANDSEVVYISSDSLEDPDERHPTSETQKHYYTNSIQLIEGNQDDDEDEDEDEEEEFEWDDVNLLNADTGVADTAEINSNGGDANNSVVGTSKEASSTQGITISLNAKETKLTSKSRKVHHLTKEEKADRILIHKLQLICLLHHNSLRNHWCNDFLLHRDFKRVLSNNILQELFPPDHLSPTLKTRKFLDGLRHACKAWSNSFRITHKGLRMLGWDEIFNKSRLIESRMGIEKFRRQLTRFRGSSDLSAQGFCALLRSVDVDARLVCSLQPLDFTSNTPMEESAESSDKDTSRAGSPSSRHPSTFHQGSAYPIYWVEAWDPASSRWVSVDPTVTQSVEVVRGRSKLEPALSDPYNSLRYVIAFERDGTARDVTRRYAYQYNSKTRKKRITNTESGAVWWERVMRYFTPRQLDPRAIAEIAELKKREASEGLPTNIQDFKGHPIYVLEQHLRQNEVLDPKVPCGTLALKHTKKIQRGSFEAYVGGKTCPVYHRKHVKIVRSAQSWYRLGRVVKAGSQPLKHTKARKSLSSKYSDTEDAGEEEANVGMYSLDQTTKYVPPPIVDGKVPRNAFRNIDVYVPSMIPEGGRHLRYPNINLAAKILGVDYADAVCGFDFARRKMNPRIEGIVIAAEFEEAVMEVYNHLVYEKEEEDKKVVEAKALLRWKRYLIALQIKSRLNRVHGKLEEESIPKADGSGSDSDVVVSEVNTTPAPKGRFDLSDIDVEKLLATGRLAPASSSVDNESSNEFSFTVLHQLDGNNIESAIVVSSRENSVEAEPTSHVRSTNMVSRSNGEVVSASETQQLEDDTETQPVTEIPQNAERLSDSPKSTNFYNGGVQDAKFSTSNQFSMATVADETQLTEETQLTSLVETQITEETQQTSFVETQDLTKSDDDSSGGFMAESMSESELLAELDEEMDSS
ncbi:Rad4p [Sugiyamaella lignohabitans]|uniref:Rad4p n=1 Tax=Sugiyamaella lignohabitans TaxID=796027 RepID=A0A167D1R9_9ASCO|nr:Rad4p [Sugiyamaella lignohabitans]ANB12373.1 Rad4p [Sugiyamaella lignohabitans]